MIDITILSDNYVDVEGLTAEHGFSCLIKTGGLTVLFDTGQGLSLANNLERLKLTPPFDITVLSHGHYDHTGGLVKAMRDGKALSNKLFVSEDIFDNHLKLNTDGTFSFIGFDSDKESLERLYKLKMTDGKQEIAKNIFVCGPVPQYFPFSADKNLYADTNAGTEKDPFRDEQFLVIDDGALVVLTGCSHCGIMNVVEHTIKMFPEKKIRSLVGGFHLFRATDTQVEEALNYLKSKNISNICTGHCTGLDALYKLKDALGERVLMTKVGLQAFV